jgi:acyl phosphate:glycerol-3-phosphate acyltransferase
VPVVLVDIAKGWIPVWLFSSLAGVTFPWTLAYGTAAIFGHMFSFWVGFRGGKGMATSAGAFLGLAPWAVLGGLVVWLAVALPTGYVSLGSIAATVALPVLIAFLPHQGGSTLVWFSSALAVFVIWKHRENVSRLRRGEENRFGRRGASKSGVGGGHNDGRGPDHDGGRGPGSQDEPHAGHGLGSDPEAAAVDREPASGS